MTDRNDFAPPIGARETSRSDFAQTIAVDPPPSTLTADQITVRGSRAGNAALASLITVLARQGLVIDATTAS
jgi:hypothetical protein